MPGELQANVGIIQAYVTCKFMVFSDKIKYSYKIQQIGGVDLMILDKKQMTEEDINLNYITPALNAAGWENGVNITMEAFPV